MIEKEKYLLHFCLEEGFIIDRGSLKKMVLMSAKEQAKIISMMKKTKKKVLTIDLI